MTGADVLVFGGGPAGWAVAGACARQGLSTTLVSPEPEATWPATYGLWRDEVPELPDSAVAAAPGRTLATGRTTRELRREYLVLDNDGLRSWLAHPEVTRHAGTVARVCEDGRGVLLADGARLAARVLIDATGARGQGGAEQTAYGLVLPAEQARRLVPVDDAVFMDWSDSIVDRADSLADRTFLYAVPLGGNRVLVEETSLARRPGLPEQVLARRLHARLTAAGITASGQAERVRIPLDLPPARTGPVLSFGAGAGLINPATGYSLATSLRLAPRVAAAVAEGLRTGPEAAVRAGRRVLWPPSARAVHLLRRHGLRVLRQLPAEAVPDFFELFFGLAEPAQRAFTSGREDPRGTAGAMLALFARAPWRLRLRLLAFRG